jgi:hypothetical protein
MIYTYEMIARAAPEIYGPEWGYKFARAVGVSRRLIAHWRKGHPIRPIYQHAIRVALKSRAKKS